MTEPLAFLNGRVVPQSQAHLALNDAGFVFGATITDLCRTFRHRLYRWADHLARFRRSCRSAYLELPFDDATVTQRAEELVAHHAGLIEANADLALVLFATPGPVGYYLGQDVAAGEQPTFGMHTFVLPFARYRPWVEKGVVLATPSVRQIPAACIDPHIKQRSRLHWWLAAEEVNRNSPSPPTPLPQGARGAIALPLLLDLEGNVTETASANLLLVRNGTILSPPRESILEGVSLGAVAELCGGLGVPLVHRPLSLVDCYAADEAILTCTSYCLAGVRQLNDRVIPWPGPMLRRLLDAWSAEVRFDIHRQILGGLASKLT
jgi:branched-chain amino acid aminotransferase